MKKLFIILFFFFFGVMCYFFFVTKGYFNKIIEGTKNLSIQNITESWNNNADLNEINESVACDTSVIRKKTWYLITSENEEAFDGWPWIVLDPKSNEQFEIGVHSSNFIQPSVFSGEYIIYNDLDKHHAMYNKLDKNLFWYECKQYIWFESWVFQYLNRLMAKELTNVLRPKCTWIDTIFSGNFIIEHDEFIYSWHYWVMSLFIWEPKNPIHWFYIVNNIPQDIINNSNKWWFFSGVVKIYNKEIECWDSIFTFPYCSKNKEVDRCIWFIDIIEWDLGKNPLYN